MTDTNRRIRVLVVIKCLDRGGAERLVTTMIGARDRDRFDYEVAYVIEALDGLAGELIAAGVPVHSLGGKGNLDLGWLPRLRRMIRDGRFDIVHTHLSYAAIGTRVVARSLPRRARPKLVYTEHSVRDHLLLPIRLLAWLTLPLDDRVLAVGHTNRALLPRHARRRTEVVVHGVTRSECIRTAEDRRAVRAELGIADGDVLIVTVANLRPQKAYPTLLRAVRILLDEDWPIVVVAAGGGPLLSELEALHDELGLGDRFRFLGFHPDTVSLSAAADIFVLASDYEAMPVAVMEAMTVGTPIVSTATGDIPLAIENDATGVLVPPGDPGLVAGGLRRLLADPAMRERLGVAAGEASVQFDITRAVHRVESIYVELVGEGPRSPSPAG